MNSFQTKFLKQHTGHNFLLSNPTSPRAQPESNQMSEKDIGKIWSKHNFEKNKINLENLVILKTSWGENSAEDGVDGTIPEASTYDETDDAEDHLKEIDIKEEHPEEQSPNNDHLQEETSPSHHARRPPNAFLIFCKKHRPIVRQKYPNTENRGVTKILGEWWALLNSSEKQPYNDLAKEYKDAFLSANPGFRWYKLPAPPLRTLTTRPTTISKPPPATISSPPVVSLSEFTPGKLADESQLGGLTSLMNNNYSPLKKSEEQTQCCKVEDNNNEKPDIQPSLDMTIEAKIQQTFSSPTNLIRPTLPPKPIKKRIYEQYEDEKNCAKNIFEDKSESLTQQDLLNKVVDDIFANDKFEPKEQRKSDRMCKGKRYERFMVEGRLLGNKRDTKLTQHNRVSRIESKLEQELTVNKPAQEPHKFDLENTIKRLAERTHIKIIEFEDKETKPKVERTRTISETSEGSNPNLKSPTVNFNLDLRIDNLTSLSYDDFVKRKRESKKRKMKIKSEYIHSKTQKLEETKPEVSPVVGSKKRKNKQTITHLNKNDSDKELEGENALLGLATLAMVAASTKKIEENSST